MEVGWATFLVRITFVDGGVDGANGTSSSLARRTRCLLRSTWTSSYWIVIHITVLIELNGLAGTLSTMNLIKWRLGILSCSSRDHAISILCIQSSTNSRFNHLISRILLLWILLVYDVLLELSLLRWVLVLLFQRNLLNIHLLLHPTLTNYRCLIRIQPGFLLIVDVRWLNYYPGNVGTIFKLIISRDMPSNNGLCAWIFRLLCFRINTKSIVIWLFWLRSFLSLHLFVEGLTLLEYLHEFCINLITVQLLKDVFLMLKLILWLFCLFSSHLLLQLSISVLRFGLLCFCSAFLTWVRFGKHILTMRLCSLTGLLLLLVMRYAISMWLPWLVCLLPTVRLVIAVWILILASSSRGALLGQQALLDRLLLPRLTLVLVESLKPIDSITGCMALHIQGISTNAQRFLISALKWFLIVYNMHWKRLIRQATNSLISAVLLIHVLILLFVIELLT